MGKEEEAPARFGEPREGKRLSGRRPRSAAVDGGSVGRGASGDSSGPVVRPPGRALASHVWGTAIRAGLGAWRRDTPACCAPALLRLPAAGAPVDDSPRPRGPALPSVVGPRCAPPHVPRGGRPSAWSSPLLPFRLSPPRFRARARPGFFPRGPGPLRLRVSPGGGRRPLLPPSPLARSSSPAPPVPGLSRPRPEGQGSPRPPRRCASLSRVCRGGPPRPHTRPPGPRPRPSARNLGVVSRRGVSRGSACRLAAARRFPAGGLSRFGPPAALLPSRPARPSASRRRARSLSLRRRVGISGGFPSVPTGDRRPRGRFSSLLPPGCLSSSSSPRSARSLARFSRLRSTAGHPSARRSPASSRSYLVDPASSICLSQRLSHACLSTHGRYSETANGSLNQLWFLWSLAPLLLG